MTRKKIYFFKDIEKKINSNKIKKKKIFKGKDMQVFNVNLKKGDKIDFKKFSKADVYIQVSKGTAHICEKKSKNCEITNELKNGDASIISSGTVHKIFNSGEEDLKFLLIYSEPVV